MASAKKTDNYGLNLWQEGDKPHMKDFNEDNLLLDEVLGNKADVGIAPIDIEYADGFTNANHVSYYAKDGLGIVSVAFKAISSKPLTAGSIYLVATVPEGFRPTFTTCVHISGWQATNQALTQNGCAVGVWIYSNGRFLIMPSISGGTYYSGHFTYHTAL